MPADQRDTLERAALAGALRVSPARLRSQVPKFAAFKVSEVTRHGGRVVLLTYQGDSAKDPVTGKVVREAFERYAFHRSGHEALPGERASG